RGVVFDAETGLKLDIYRPKGAGPFPVVVFFYGGRWTEGRRQDYAFVGTSLARAGYLTVIPDYRKYPDVRFPAFVEDGARAVAWVAREIAEDRGDLGRLFLSGHSAGAHIGALLAADRRYLRAAGAAETTLAGFAGLAGPYHFTPDAPDLQDMFGPPQAYPEMQVGSFADAQMPPMLFLWGGADETVGLINIERVEAAAPDACTARRAHPGVDHIGMIASLAWVYRPHRAVFGDLTAFFDDPTAICR
ncbi:MAG: alpha/beta hydrolase, partial [Pseudomonadota bacterium]